MGKMFFAPFIAFVMLTGMLSTTPASAGERHRGDAAAAAAMIGLLAEIIAERRDRRHRPNVVIVVPTEPTYQHLPQPGYEHHYGRTHRQSGWDDRSYRRQCRTYIDYDTYRCTSFSGVSGWCSKEVTRRVCD